jgi:hypothetical protein
MERGYCVPFSQNLLIGSYLELVETSYLHLLAYFPYFEKIKRIL